MGAGIDLHHLWSQFDLDSWRDKYPCVGTEDSLSFPERQIDAGSLNAVFASLGVITTSRNVACRLLLGRP